MCPFIGFCYHYCYWTLEDGVVVVKGGCELRGGPAEGRRFWRVTALVNKRKRRESVLNSAYNTPNNMLMRPLIAGGVIKSGSKRRRRRTRNGTWHQQEQLRTRKNCR